MEQGKQDINSFHLSGIIPVAGQPLDFNFPWPDCMMPLAPNYLAIHHAVMECAWAGCETIWIVCHHDMQPLIRHEVGEYVQDPVWYYRSYDTFPSESRRPIPIYYVPIHPKDRDKRDCLGWSVLYGANTAYWISRKLSRWVAPDKYYVAFPYGIYGNELLREHRKDISSKKRFILTHEDKYINSGIPAGFTFDAEDFKKIRRELRASATGLRPKNSSYGDDPLPIEKRWSARHFSLDKVFESVIIDKDTKSVEVPWFHKVDNWEGYCAFLSSDERHLITRPFNKILKYNELNLIGENHEQD